MHSALGWNVKGFQPVNLYCDTNTLQQLYPILCLRLVSIETAKIILLSDIDDKNHTFLSSIDDTFCYLVKNHVH